MGDYNWFRQYYQDISGQLVFATSQDDVTLVTARNANHTLHIQRLRVTLTTATAATISFEDSAGTPIRVAYVDGAVGANAPWVFDFGPKGVSLTDGKNLVMNVSATGNAGRVSWEGYQRFSTAAAPESM